MAVSRVSAVFGRVRAIDATRVDETTSWVLYFLILGRFGRRRRDAATRLDLILDLVQHFPLLFCEQGEVEEHLM